MDDGMKAGYTFLLERGGPVLKLEAAEALGVETPALRAAMLSCPAVSYWLDQADLFRARPMLHGSFDRCLENLAHVLISLGVRASDDGRLEAMSEGLLDAMERRRGDSKFYDTINPSIICTFLLWTGRLEGASAEFMIERLQTVYAFVKQARYDIYVDPTPYPKIPAARARHPLVDPALYEGNRWRLPNVHDLFNFVRLADSPLAPPDAREQAEAIARYVLHERYQRLHPGYGLMLIPPHSFYSMGWSMHLPGYFGEADEGAVWALSWLSPYREARESEWYQTQLARLRSFREGNVYRFPAAFLPEGRDRYFVGGGHMSLGEDHKSPDARVLTSTAWMLRILRAAA